MSTFALVGAGRLEGLAAGLSRDGIQARAFPADVLDRASLTAALREAADALGPRRPADRPRGHPAGREARQ